MASNGADKSDLFVLHVAVGSENPCKIDSVREALQRILIQTSSQCKVSLQLQGFGVESGVSAQPFGDEETQLGGKNRAKSAYERYKEKFGHPPTLSVGLEGGLEWSPDKVVLWCMAWMCCYGKRTKELVELFSGADTSSFVDDKDFIWGMAKTAMFPMPPPVTELVKQGLELGDADDKVFSRVNSKQGSGTVGILSNGTINRSAYYEHALILALVPWIRPDVYPRGFASQV